MNDKNIDEKIKIKFPQWVSPYKRLLYLAVIGFIYIVWMIGGVPSSFSNAHQLHNFGDKVWYYKEFFFVVFVKTGIISLMLFKALPYREFIKVITVFVISVYVLSFLMCSLIIYMGFSGLGSIMEIFPLNLIAAFLVALATKSSVVIAFFYSCWGFVFLLFNESKKEYPRHMKALFIVLQVLSLFIPFLSFSLIKYPFNQLQFM